MGWAHALVAEKRQPPFSHYHYNHNIYQQHYQHQHHHHQNPAAQSSVYYPTVYPGSNEMTSSSLQGQANSGTHIRGYQQPQNVKAAAADPASNTTVSPSSSATSGGNWPWRLILEGALLEWRLGRRQLALATLDHVQRVLPHRAQPYLHSVDLLKKESRYIEAYRIAVSALRLLPSAGMLWFEALALQLHLLLTWKRSCDKQSPVSDAEMQTVSTLPWRVLADPSATTTDANTTNVTADFEGRSVDCSGASCPWSIEQILDNKAHRLLHFSSVWLPQLQADALDHLSPELTHRFLIEVARAHVLAGEHASQSQPSSQDKPAESRSSSTSNTFLTRARRALASAVRAAPPNLQFKVWLEGARLELRYGDSKVARKSLLQAVKLAPLKSRSAVLTEWARLEQYLPSPNRFDEARRILNKAKRSMPSDWKVHLESILLEMRAGAFAFALALTHEALRLFPSSGRLVRRIEPSLSFQSCTGLTTCCSSQWALRVQLEYLCYHQQQRSSGGALPSSKLSVPRSAMRALEEATRQCPKSGEVWCEAARLAIANREFSLARRYLEYSTHFTPQLGDSLVEWLRLEMLEQNVIAGTTASDRSIKDQMTALYGTVGRADLSPPNYGMVWTFCKNLPLDSTLHTLLVSTQRQLVALSVGGNNAASSSPSPQEATTTTATVVPLPSTTYAASLDIASWVATLNFASVDSVLRFKLLFD
jgi:tetratricopeptide (TPR) repeat protein